MTEVWWKTVKQLSAQYNKTFGDLWRLRSDEKERNPVYLLNVRWCYLANCVKEAVSSRKSLIDRRRNVEYTRSNSAAKMTVQLVRFGVGELAGAQSTAAWTGPTFGSICKDSKSHRHKELPTARAWSSDGHAAPPVGHTKGRMERLEGLCDNTGTYLRCESS